MIVGVHCQFREQLHDWIIHQKRIGLKIFDLMAAIERNPFEGIGKPEPLKHGLTGYWSRRIDARIFGRRRLNNVYFVSWAL
jgi:Txe/YoeB family toxin of toxin-antitoxin system